MFRLSAFSSLGVLAQIFHLNERPQRNHRQLALHLNLQSWRRWLLRAKQLNLWGFRSQRQRVLAITMPGQGRNPSRRPPAWDSQAASLVLISPVSPGLRS